MMRDSALGLVPETLEHYIALGQALWSAGPLGPAELEVARLRNARRVNCVFCKNVRYDIALQDGLTEARIARIDDGYEQSDLSERDKLIIAWVDQFYASPGEVSAALVARLQAQFSAEELAHLALAVLYFSGFSRCAVALGGMPDELPLMQISVPD
ncbi:MAG: hypothetical protein Hals2KO_05570 [Halioglobus sp.]